MNQTKRHLTPPGWKPPFHVPAHLTANIPQRMEPIETERFKTKRVFGPTPKFSTLEQRRRNLKRNLRVRHAHRIDLSISILEERLDILKEIRDELKDESGPA